MCLAVPGKIIACREGPGGLPFASVAFGSVTREVCLAYTPEAQPGEYVIVHVGFAIQRLDERAALETLAALDEAVRADAALALDPEPSLAATDPEHSPAATTDAPESEPP